MISDSSASLPQAVDNEGFRVDEVRIRRLPCPNPDCDSRLDVTNVNAGTKIKCPSCGNVTWLPDDRHKWWQKPLDKAVPAIGGLVLGVLATLIGQVIWVSLSPAPDQEQTENAQAPERD